jgi:hypothetical protein
MFFKIRCIGFTFLRSKFSALLDWFLHHTLFHGFDTLGSHLREEGSLDYDGGSVRLQVHSKINTNIHRQQAPYPAPLSGNKWSRFNLLLLFCVIFSFLLVFLLHLLTFDHPQKQSNQVCLTLVFLYMFLFFIFHFFISCLSLTLTGDGWLPLQQTR